MARKRSAAEQRCKEIMAFVGGYVSRNGYSPTFREIGEAVGLHSAASISRYSHRLAQEGRISIDESKPRTISTAARLNDVDFPTDDSLLKMLYLAMMDITKKCTGRRQDWALIHAQLAIYFAGRMPE